jgi:murein DD-endopeptidase MepM/ murein hydrolase activator NlpD
LSVPAIGAIAAAGAVLVVVLGLGAIWGDYLSLHRQRSDMRALQRLTTEQQALLETLGRRVADIQGEVGAWRTLHARIWEPLGPEVPGTPERRGVGGPAGPVAEGQAGPATLPGQVDRLAVAVGEEGQKLRALEGLTARLGKVLAALPSRWPVRGTVNSEFGRRVSPWSGSHEHHSGMDIAADIGTPVKAPAPGTVVFAGAMADYGTALVIEHGHEIRTLFGHLSRVHVTPGQKVERGQLVALSGNTGKSSGPHLHYEIQVKGQPVNPRAYLWE